MNEYTEPCFCVDCNLALWIRYLATVTRLETQVRHGLEAFAFEGGLKRIVVGRACELKIGASKMVSRYYYDTHPLQA